MHKTCARLVDKLHNVWNQHEQCQEPNELNAHVEWMILSHLQAPGRVTEEYEMPKWIKTNRELFHIEINAEYDGTDMKSLNEMHVTDDGECNFSCSNGSSVSWPIYLF